MNEKMNEKVARDLNIVTLNGRLGNEPELKKTTNDLSVVEFRLANNRDYKSNGEVVKRVNWITCRAYAGLAETICNYLKKGAKVNVVGELREDSWTAEDGTMRSRTYMLVTEMNFLEARNADNAVASQEQPTNRSTGRQQQSQQNYSYYDDYNF